ncbi:MAG: PQQ-dependent sugar dehydrogenase [Acidobacteria bacterium]|nr:PQQ-dependent sugar dehydrogenase [Acidobacteriota bacterium]
MRVRRSASRLAVSLVLACGTAVAIAQTPPAPLTAELADVIEMPRTPGANGGTLSARVNVLLEEPGSERLFVAEHAGALSIVDKTTRQAVTYINFDGVADAPGVFPKFAPTGGFVSGLMGFAFDPDYRRNGVFYTIHLENPALTGDGTPKAGGLPGLDASRFVTTKPITMPANGQNLTREGVLTEWTDTNIRNATFEGTVREVMRVQLLNSIHPMSDLSFNPAATPGSADWRVLYVSVGDGGTGEQADVRRLNPQRLDHFSGAIIRIIPDLREHASSSQVSDNGQYRIPNDNPFVSTPGARKEIFAYGMRNPHRLTWDVPPGPGSQATLLAFVIGSNFGSPVRYETINVIRRGANYGYPLREGPEFKPESPVYGPMSADNTLPVRISDTVVLDQRIPMQDSALAYRTGVEGLAISNGFVYRGKRWPQLQGAVVFGDITSGRLFYARMADLMAATDGNPATLAPFTEITTNLRDLVQARMATFPPPPPRGGGPAPAGPAAPPAAGAAAPAPPAGPADGRAGGPGAGRGGGRGPAPLRLELRIATDAAGEIYLLTKSDGSIRRVTNIR